MIGHLCNQDHCREYGCIELKKQARHLYTKPTLTRLEQFNEEVRRDIDIHFDKNFEFHGSYLGIRDFFLERLQAHKSLILKMVREKFPNTERGFLDEEIDPWQRGFNACLDQIKDELESL